MTDKGCNYAARRGFISCIGPEAADHTQFRVAVFTNLTGDHLDFHGTMESYFQSKLRLFMELLIDGAAVINLDDPYGKRLSELLRDARPSIRSDHIQPGGSNADVLASDIILGFRGTSFSISAKNTLEGMKLLSPMVGRTGIYNVLSAVCAALPLVLPLKSSCRACSSDA